MSNTAEKVKEHEELIETLKGPHFYRIRVSGSGGETVYATISEKVREFWEEIIDEGGDSDLVSYCTQAEWLTAKEIMNGDADNLEFDNVDVNDMPREALFLHNGKDDETGIPWHEMPSEVFHNYVAQSDYAYIDVDKVSQPDWNGVDIETIIEREDIWDLYTRITDADDSIEPQVYPPVPEIMKSGDNVLEFTSSEKGEFFEAYIELPGLFDFTKLQFIAGEDASGTDQLFGIMYDGEEIDNEGGGDTNHKGYYASVWKED